MAKVYPQTLSSSSSFSSSSSPSSSSSSSSSPYFTSQPECFTIWMKSLVFNSYGCTVYNSNGEIIYRVDNYENKCSREVYLMDIRGNVLFSIRQKKLRVFGYWDGYKWDDDCGSEKQPCFRVRKQGTVHVNMGCDHRGRGSTYKIFKTPGKLGFKIVDIDQEGAIVAEVKQKQTAAGVKFGDDVFTLMVEPHIDHSLIMSIVMVHGLINHQL